MPTFNFAVRLRVKDKPPGADLGLLIKFCETRFRQVTPVAHRRRAGAASERPYGRRSAPQIASVSGFFMLAGSGWRDAAKNWDARAAQDIFDYEFFETRGIVIEMQQIFVFLEAEALQAVGICELAEGAELLGLQRMLQFVGHRHVSHGCNYSKCESSALRRLARR
jgi:hypothetical protein